jgi:hypothetical protein
MVFNLGVSPERRLFLSIGFLVLVFAVIGIHAGRVVGISDLVTSVAPPATSLTAQDKAFNGAQNAGSQLVRAGAVPQTSDSVGADNVLVVYNSNSAESMQVRDYYLANRPGFANVNILGVSTDDVEVVDQKQFLSNIRQPIVDWITSHASRPIYYIVLLRGIPDRTYTGTGASVDYQISMALSDLGIRAGAVYSGGTGIAYTPSKYPGTTALVTHLNMGSLEATLAYIAKLKAMHKAMRTPNVVISGKTSGRSGDQYCLDGSSAFSGFEPIIRIDYEALVSLGVASSRITYATASLPHITTCSNVAGYETWGANGGLAGDYAKSGFIRFRGHSNWFLIKTIESFNGQWTTSQGNFVNWFSAKAFGGTDYSNTPVGATTNVEEPTTAGLAGPSYLADWEKGMLFAEAAWDSRQTTFFMAIGDPLVTR